MADRFIYLFLYVWRKAFFGQSTVYSIQQNQRKVEYDTHTIIINIKYTHTYISHFRVLYALLICCVGKHVRIQVHIESSSLTEHNKVGLARGKNATEIATQSSFSRKENHALARLKQENATKVYGRLLPT